MDSAQSQLKTLSSRLSAIEGRSSQLSAMFKHVKFIDFEQKKRADGADRETSQGPCQLEEERSRRARGITADLVTCLPVPFAEPSSSTSGVSLWDELAQSAGVMGNAFNKDEQLTNYQQMIMNLQNQLAIVTEELEHSRLETEFYPPQSRYQSQPEWQELDLEVDDDSAVGGSAGLSGESRSSVSSAEYILCKDHGGERA